MFKKESLPRYLITAIVFLGLYLILAQAGQILAENTGQLRLVWPATGLAFALLLIFGVRYWPAVFIGALIASLTFNESVFAALGVATGDVLGVLIPTLLLRHWKFSESLRQVSDVTKFIFAGVVFGPAISASLSAIVLTASGVVDFQVLAQILVAWFLSGVVGVLMVTPLILAFRERSYREIIASKSSKAIIILASVLVAAFIFARQDQDSLIFEHVRFIIFPIIIWSAVAISQIGVSVSVFLVGVIAVANILINSGHTAGMIGLSVHNHNLILLHVFMFFGATSAMLLAAAINETKEAQKQTAESENRYRQLVELSPDAIFIQSDGRFTFLNSSAIRMCGANHAEELIGRSVLDFVHHDYAAGAKQKNRGFTEQRITRLDGSSLLVELAAVPFNYQGKIAAQVIMRDIRSRKEAEQRLKISLESIEREKARDEALLGSIAEGVVAIDTTGRVIYINDQAKSLLGFSNDEILGKNFNELVPAEDERGISIPVDKRPFYLAVSTRKRTGSASDYIIRKDKVKVPVLATAAPVILDGKVVGAIGTYRDITKEKEIEKAKTEFVSLASHQLRSPLTAFKWVIELLRNDKKTSAKVREKIDYLYRANDRLIVLVNDLLSVSRIDVGASLVHKRVSDVKKLIADVVDTLKPDAEARKQKIVISMKIELVSSVIDPNLFSEAFKNILDNAISYGTPGSDIKIAVDQQSMNFLVSVYNDGPPIAPEDKVKLFTRFYRGVGASVQKPTGSGLGLFIAKSSIESNGGKIWFESGVKKGTTFYFTVPITS